MDIEQFIPLAEFRQRMNELMAEHRDVPVANGVERLYLPGEIEHLRREQRLVSGIPLEPYIIEALTQLGEELRLDTSILQL
jgi:LDH2 family malate/lactate/ureidoglycolate dehydrogenase